MGLTGNIATGKSTALAYLRGRGAEVIDADKLAHAALLPGGPAYRPAIEAFGAGIVQADGTIERATLGRIVFAAPAALTRLEQIVHPAVFELAKGELARSTAAVVVIEAIKLLESDRLVRLCDEIWVVTATPEAQLRRLVNERKMDEADARQRMAAQSPQEAKVARATRVIENSGTPQQLYEKLDSLWNELMETRAERSL